MFPIFLNKSFSILIKKKKKRMGGYVLLTLSSGFSPLNRRYITQDKIFNFFLKGLQFYFNNKFKKYTKQLE